MSESILNDFKIWQGEKTKNLLEQILNEISCTYNIKYSDLESKYIDPLDKLILNNKDKLKEDKESSNNTSYNPIKYNITSQKINTKKNNDKSKNTNSSITHNTTSNTTSNNYDLNKCHGLTKSLSQCTRNPKNGTYCGTHLNNLKYGSINIDNKHNEGINNEINDEINNENNNENNNEINEESEFYEFEANDIKYIMNNLRKVFLASDLTKVIGFLDDNNLLHLN